MAETSVTTESSAEFARRLSEYARADRPLDREMAERVLTDGGLDLNELLEFAEIPREKYFGRKVQVHILNNIRNGHCPEDCGYCAQRKTAPADSIPSYTEKSEDEILREAERAYNSGAFRYCLVTAGRGPSAQSVKRLAGVIRKVKERYPLEICLSGGILTKPELAAELADAGLDRYNHNLNTSEDFYEEIASSHTYADREDTLKTLSGAGVSLCSGVITGMGESAGDMAATATRLQELGVASIPVNFFIPVPGHAIKEPRKLTADECLRMLCMYRLANPRAEIRMAAGRELYLKERQAEGLRAANSLFVSGYLNVKGSPARDTVAMIQDGGYELDVAGSDRPEELARMLDDMRSQSMPAPGERAFAMKAMDDLRPFQDQ